jgi:hypothetical protein
MSWYWYTVTNMMTQYQSGGSTKHQTDPPLLPQPPLPPAPFSRAVTITELRVDKKIDSLDPLLYQILMKEHEMVFLIRH